jgi:hypothetical protein
MSYYLPENHPVVSLQTTACGQSSVTGFGGKPHRPGGYSLFVRVSGFAASWYKAANRISGV